MHLTALIVIGIIALIITAVMMISIGADISFIDDKLVICASLCGKTIQVFPKSEKKQSKPPKEKKPKKPKEEKPDKKEKKGGIPLDLNFDEIIGLLKKVLKGLAKFKNFSVDYFMLHFIVSGYDPCDTAVFFGKLNATLSFLGAYCQQNLRIKHADVFTDIDFLNTLPKIDFRVAVSIRIGQIFGVINTILFGALGIVIKNRIRVFKEKKQNKRELPVTEENNNNTDTSTISQEERNNENGAE